LAYYAISSWVEYRTEIAYLLSRRLGVLPVRRGWCVFLILLGRSALLSTGCRFRFLFFSAIAFLNCFGFPGTWLGWGLLRWRLRLALILDAGRAATLASVGSSRSSFTGHAKFGAGDGWGVVVGGERRAGLV
jgi:hypothetical protein